MIIISYTILLIAAIMAFFSIIGVIWNKYDSKNYYVYEKLANQDKYTNGDIFFLITNPCKPLKEDCVCCKFLGFSGKKALMINSNGDEMCISRYEMAKKWISYEERNNTTMYQSTKDALELYNNILNK